MFFAKGIYPFQGENEVIEGLAMTTVSHEIMQAAEHRSRFNREACVESFKRSGHRINGELEGNDNRTYWVREEHRISISLLGQIIALFNAKDWPTIGYRGTHLPYVILPTPIVNKFTQNVVFNWSCFFQEALGSGPPGYLSTEHRKLATLAAMMIKVSWGTGALSQHRAIWKERYRYGTKNEKGPQGEVTGLPSYKRYLLCGGLDGERILDSLGFLFLSKSIFAICNMSFTTPEHAKEFACPMNLLERQFDHTCQISEHLMALIKDLDTVVEYLKLNSDDQGTTDWLIHYMAVRIFNSWHLEVFDSCYKSPCTFPSKHSDQSSMNAKRIEVVRVGPAPNDGRVYKKFLPKDVPLLIYDDVKEELGEPPVGVNRGNKRRTIRQTDKHDYFYETFIHFLPDHDNILDHSIIRDPTITTTRQHSWKGRTYLIGLKHVLKLLEHFPLLRTQLITHLENIYLTYAQCVPAHTLTMFLGRNKGKKGEAPGLAWAGFGENGKQLRLNESDAKKKGEKELMAFRDKGLEISGWRQPWGRNRIDGDLAWGMTGEEATKTDTISKAKRSVIDLATGQKHGTTTIRKYPKSYSGQQLDNSEHSLVEVEKDNDLIGQQMMDESTVNDATGTVSEVEGMDDRVPKSYCQQSRNRNSLPTDRTIPLSPRLSSTSTLENICLGLKGTTDELSNKCRSFSVNSAEERIQKEQENDSSASPSSYVYHFPSESDIRIHIPYQWTILMSWRKLGLNHQGESRMERKINDRDKSSLAL